jgi:hypothetical protein
MAIRLSGVTQYDPLDDDGICISASHAHPTEWRRLGYEHWLQLGHKTKNTASRIHENAIVYGRAAAQFRPISLSGLVTFENSATESVPRAHILSRVFRSLRDESVRKLRLKRTFTVQAKLWKEETQYLSSATQIVLHPSYQRIIGLGPDVIPLILQEMKKEPDYWFAALEALTGENPVRSEDTGRIQVMTHAWLEWGKRESFV